MNKEGNEENHTKSVMLIDKGMWDVEMLVSVSLSD